MKGMRGCRVFKCDDCGKIKSIKQQNVKKAAYTSFDAKSENELSYFVYHIQLCNSCDKKTSK